MQESTFVGRFEIEPSVPTEFLAKVIKLLQPLEKLIPAWCHEVFVRVSTDLAPATAASISCAYDYRRATLSLAMGFFQEPDRQLVALVHELCHITQEPLWNTLIDLKSRLIELDKGNENFVNELCRHAREQSVCDMTALVMQAHGLTSTSCKSPVASVDHPLD